MSDYKLHMEVFMQEKVETKTIASYARLKNSHMGNPAFAITFKDGGTIRTKANCSCAYLVCNSLIGQTRQITTTTSATGRVRIVNIE
jgi:hypothetical protein